MSYSFDWILLFKVLGIYILIVYLIKILIWKLCKHKAKWLLLLGICVLVPAILFIYFFMPFVPVEKPILISRVTTQSGMEMCLTQTHNKHILEPYTISFYYKDSDDESWKWFYIDHEDVYWWSGDIKLNEDNKRATLFRGSKELAYFDWEQEMLTFLDSGRIGRTAKGEIISGAKLQRLGLLQILEKAK